MVDASDVRSDGADLARALRFEADSTVSMAAKANASRSGIRR